MSQFLPGPRSVGVKRGDGGGKAARRRVTGHRRPTRWASVAGLLSLGNASTARQQDIERSTYCQKAAPSLQGRGVRPGTIARFLPTLWAIPILPPRPRTEHINERVSSAVRALLGKEVP